MSREEMLHWAVCLRDITVGQKASELTLVQSAPGKTTRYVPTPEMAVSFSLDKDTRKKWEIQHTDGSAVGVIMELVPKGDSINAWKEMVEQQTSFTKASVRQFVDAWKAGLLKADPKSQNRGVRPTLDVMRNKNDTNTPTSQRPILSSAHGVCLLPWQRGGLRRGLLPARAALGC